MNELITYNSSVVFLLIWYVLSVFVNSMLIQRIHDMQDKFDLRDYTRNWPFGTARTFRLTFDAKCNATKQQLRAGTTVVRFRGHTFAIDTPEARRLLRTKYAPFPDAFG